MTPRQHECLAIIGNHIAEHGYAPSYREIAGAMKQRSVGVVYALVQRLVSHGLLSVAPGARGIAILLAPIPDRMAAEYGPCLARRA